MSETQNIAYLVGIETEANGPEQCRELLAELASLVDTLGMEMAGCEVAKQREPNPRYLVGTGKAAELVQNAKDAGAGTIIFDETLTPAQQRNWERISGLAVIDRQEVILEIFSQHARTREAVLQIQLAQATYSLPRLKRKWTHLNRERGMAGGMGLRGGGEQQIELDSRVVRMRIAQLKRQLAEVRQHREVQHRQRINKPVPVAALVGYTNVGKSSLLNALTQANVLVADRLFATLDPVVRRFLLPGGQRILLADTVGFVRKLPHLLVEAFHSTLEETAQAQLIVEVLDATSPILEEQHTTTLRVLRECGVDPKIATVLVLNKIDLLEDPVERRRLLLRYPEAVCCSAATGEGLKELGCRLEDAVNENSVEASLVIPPGRADVLAHLREVSAVLSEKWEADGVHVRMRIPPAAWPLAEKYAVREEE